MKTGNTAATPKTPSPATTASMEPGHEDREYGAVQERCGHGREASMEPGHEDREYPGSAGSRVPPGAPQWSPVMKTGNTYRPRQAHPT